MIFFSNILSINKSSLSILGVKIRYYAICYIIAFHIVRYFAIKRLKSKTYINKEIQLHIDNSLSNAFIIGILGGRIGHLTLENWNNSCLLGIKRGILSTSWYGMDFKTGMISFTIAIIIFIFNNKHIKNYFLHILESISVYAPWGILIGRFGNLLNQEFMYAVNLHYIEVPLCVFAMITEGMISGIFMKLVEGIDANNKIFYFLSSYSLMRFVNDIYRTEDRIFYFMNLSQLICVFMFFTSLFYIFSSKFLSKKKYNRI